MSEIIIIVLVVVVLFFGSGKITEFAKSLGRVTGEFKKGKREVETELKDIAEGSVVEPQKTEETNNDGKHQA